MIANKKGFTLVEMLLVIIVIGIIFASFGRKLQGTENKKYYAETCINYIKGSIENTFNNAILGKGIESADGSLLFPQEYIISFTVNQTFNDSINFGYISDEEDIVLYESIIISDTQQNRFCDDKTYEIVMSKNTGLWIESGYEDYDTTSIHIIKSLKPIINQPPVTITYSDSTNPTETETSINSEYPKTSIMLQQYIKQEDIYREKTRMIFDTRTQTLISQRCFVNDINNGSCLDRQE